MNVVKAIKERTPSSIITLDERIPGAFDNIYWEVRLKVTHSERNKPTNIRGVISNRLIPYILDQLRQGLEKDEM